MLELDPAIEHQFVAPDRLVFSSPRGGFTILDKAGLFRAAISCLESGAPIEQAFEQIKNDADRAAISARIIEVLQTRGIVRAVSKPGLETAKEDLLRAWLGFVGTAQTSQPLIGIIGEGRLAAALKSELVALNLAHTSTETVTDSIDLSVLCMDYEDRQKLRFANRAAIEANIPFFPVWTQRHIISLGPVIIPGATACAECLHHRDQMNRQERMSASSAVQPVSTSAFAGRFAAMLAAAEIARFLFGAIYDLHVATQTRHSLLNGKRAQSVILKLPRCPVCGTGRRKRPVVDTFSVGAQETAGALIA